MLAIDDRIELCFNDLSQYIKLSGGNIEYKDFMMSMLESRMVSFNQRSMIVIYNSSGGIEWHFIMPNFLPVWESVPNE